MKTLISLISTTRYITVNSMMIHFVRGRKGNAISIKTCLVPLPQQLCAAFIAILHHRSNIGFIHITSRIAQLRLFGPVGSFPNYKFLVSYCHMTASVLRNSTHADVDAFLQESWASLWITDNYRMLGAFTSVDMSAGVNYTTWTLFEGDISFCWHKTWTERSRHITS